QRRGSGNAVHARQSVICYGVGHLRAHRLDRAAPRPPHALPTRALRALRRRPHETISDPARDGSRQARTRPDAEKETRPMTIHDLWLGHWTVREVLIILLPIAVTAAAAYFAGYQRGRRVEAEGDAPLIDLAFG